MSEMPIRRLGRSGLHVSALSLGSWQTFEQLPREVGLAIMRAAREQGITFLDDARYDDRTGTAPMPTGYSEVVFGDLFRGAGWRREDVVVANKLWLEFWPREDLAAELDGSLRRLEFDYLDLEYCAPPPEGLTVEEIVGQVGALIASGKLRAWGVLNWPAPKIAEAAGVAARTGVPGPCAAQLAYSLVRRAPVEDAETQRVCEAAGVGVVASATLAGGVLSGKYRQPGVTGRLAGELDSPRQRAALAVADGLQQVAGELGVAPASLAIAYALANPLVASVLFGATRPEQVAQNVEALRVLPRLAEPVLERLRALAPPASPSEAPGRTA
jgi:aryl-alcohol dehydrogenase-like predicted oxidoreductase